VASDLVVRLLDMSFKVGLAVKGIPAVGADKWARVCVCVDVFIETTGAGECSSAREADGGVGVCAEVHWGVVGFVSVHGSWVIAEQASTGKEERIKKIDGRLIYVCV